jgi:hypothetical protein
VDEWIAIYVGREKYFNVSQEALVLLADKETQWGW